MNPYNVDIKKLKISKKITDPKDSLKMKLVAGFLNATSKMQTNEILDKTGLYKADLSRLRSTNIERFTIDRLVGLLLCLGLTADITIGRAKKVS